METPTEPKLNQLPPPTVSLRLESADLGLDLALLLSGPTGTSGQGFSSGSVALQKLLPALRSVGICSGAYDAAKQADLERFETAVQHQSGLRREQHEFYSKIEARFASTADTIQRMKRDYYREIDNLREQLSRTRRDPNFEPDSSVVFFDPNSYRLPSWMDIVEELDGMRMKRELLQQDIGSDRIRTVPIHMLCAGCRGKFQSLDEMATAHRPDSCNKEVQVGTPGEDFSEAAMQTDWVSVEGPLSAGARSQTHQRSSNNKQFELDRELGQMTAAENSHCSRNGHGDHSEIAGQDDVAQFSANLGDSPESFHTTTPTGAEHSTMESPGIHSAMSRKPRGEGSEVFDTFKNKSLRSHMLPEVADDATMQENGMLVCTNALDTSSHQDDSESDCSHDSLCHSSSLLAVRPAEGDAAFESFEGELMVTDDDCTDSANTQGHQDMEMSSEEARRSPTGAHGTISKGGNRANGNAGDLAREKKGRRASDKEGPEARSTDIKGDSFEGSQDSKGRDSANKQDVTCRGSEGHKNAKESDSERSSIEDRALVMQKKLEKVFSEDAKIRRRSRSRSDGRVRSSVPSHQITKRKQLAAARLARQMEAIQKHLQRQAFARLRGARLCGTSEKCDVPAGSEHSSPQSRPVPRMPVAQLGGTLATTLGNSSQANIQEEAHQRPRGDSSPPLAFRRPKGHSLAGPNLSSAASATELFGSPVHKTTGQKLRSRSATRISPTALDADLADSPQTRRAPSPAFHNRARPKTPPWGQNPGQANISSYTMDFIGAAKAQSAKNFAAAMRLSGGDLANLPTHSSFHRRPGSSSGCGAEKGLPLLARGVHCRRAP